MDGAHAILSSVVKMSQVLHILVLFYDSHYRINVDLKFITMNITIKSSFWQVISTMIWIEYVQTMVAELITKKGLN